MSGNRRDSWLDGRWFGPGLRGREHTPHPTAVGNLHRLVGHDERTTATAVGRSAGPLTNLLAAQRRNRARINRQNEKYSDQQLARLHVERYQAGLSLRAIEAETGICASTLRRRWKRMGAPLSANAAERQWVPEETGP